MRSKALLSLTLVAGLGLTACTDPYDPGQRALGGAGIGALGGAALGGAIGGGRGAAIGALGGAAVGAGAGAATTPTRPGYYQPAYQPAPTYYSRPYGY